MANENKARHAFGTSENLQNALNSGVIDAYDILFLDGDTEPKIGWVDKNGEIKIVDTDTSDLEAAIATKVTAEEVDAKITKALDNLDVDGDANVEIVQDYEISYKPEGALVDYREKEIRVMCPVDTQWALQNSGEGADSNAYYIGMKAYAPSDDVVSFKEDTAEIISDNTMYYFEGNDFAGTDENGKYSIVWLPVAKYDEATTTWTYYGANSSESHYVGWYYSVEWYNADGKVIASDCIRINLSNEDCHSNIKPFYIVKEAEETETKISAAVESANAYTDAQIEAKLAEIEDATSGEVVEF